jgi:hypothetical protein
VVVEVVVVEVAMTHRQAVQVDFAKALKTLVKTLTPQQPTNNVTFLSIERISHR